MRVDFLTLAQLKMPLLPTTKISIVIRSMARDCLREALQSVANAGFMPVEIILVNACGGHHELSFAFEDRHSFRIVNQDGSALDRSSAANLGLAESTGDFVLFLDDDDLIDVDHLERLFVCLNENPLAIAAYTGTRLLDTQGQVIREQNELWELDRLLGMNFLPIHSVMFRAARVRGQIFFDATLLLMEDWYFWSQLALQGKFIRLNGCSATYRLQHGESGLSAKRDKDAMYIAHSLVLAKIKKLDATGISRSLFWFDTALNHVRGEKQTLEFNVVALEQTVNFEKASADRFRQSGEASLLGLNSALAQADKSLSLYQECKTTLATTENEVVLAQSALAANRVKLADTQKLLATAGNDLAVVQSQLTTSNNALTKMLESTTWRMSAPLRALVTKLRSLRGNFGG